MYSYNMKFLFFFITITFLNITSNQLKMVVSRTESQKTAAERTTVQQKKEMNILTEEMYMLYQ